jgi:hypothetical protein
LRLAALVLSAACVAAAGVPFVSELKTVAGFYGNCVNDPPCERDGYGAPFASPDDARFYGPAGIAVDAQEEFAYIADYGGVSLRKMNLKSSPVAVTTREFGRSMRMRGSRWKDAFPVLHAGTT